MGARAKRIDTLDLIRGVCIIGMMFDHAMFDLAYTAGVVWARVVAQSVIWEIIKQFGAGVFILIAGVCTNLSRDNLRRGIKVLLAAEVVTVATSVLSSFVGYDMTIRFGILHFMGWSMIIYAMAERYLPKWFANPFWILVFIPSYAVYKMGLLPQVEATELYCFGLTSWRFFSADYFPLFPWIFLFIFGIWLGRYLLSKNIPQGALSLKVPVVNYIGRKPLLIYIVHQPIIYGLVLLVNNLKGI